MPPAVWLSATDFSACFGGDNQPIRWTTRLWLSARRYIFFQLDFLQEAGPRFQPASWRIAARSGTGGSMLKQLVDCWSERSRVWSGSGDTDLRGDRRDGHAQAPRRTYTYRLGRQPSVIFKRAAGTDLTGHHSQAPLNRCNCSHAYV